jgi:hypothetical protein
MKDLISREAALDFCIPTYDLNISPEDKRALGDRFEEFIKSIPATDAVNVGRCKDCIAYYPSRDNPKYYGHCKFIGLTVPNDFYCQLGEK